MSNFNIHHLFPKREIQNKVISDASHSLANACLKKIVNKRYEAYTLNNFRTLPPIRRLNKEEQFEIEVIGNVLPFKVSNYVINELINWDDIPNDPIYRIAFPQKHMLSQKHFDEMKEVLEYTADRRQINEVANRIRMELNPHPSEQLGNNIPLFQNKKLEGVQHKYKETVLLFPHQGQTCHSYCSYCFRWAQFVNLKDFKFSIKNMNDIAAYIKSKPKITDILITGGDPLVMKTTHLSKYIKRLLELDVTNIRIGTKALSFWPYRFLSGQDGYELLALFKDIRNCGKNLTIVANFNHPKELSTKAVQLAIQKILDAGIQIRTQSPILKGVNDTPHIWREMWNLQVKLGCIPYYMFIPRETGAQRFFSLPINKAVDIFKDACRGVSGLVKTVRGPVMSTAEGKLEVMDYSPDKANYRNLVFTVRYLQHRDPQKVGEIYTVVYPRDSLWFRNSWPDEDEGMYKCQQRKHHNLI